MVLLNFIMSKIRIVCSLFVLIFLGWNIYNFFEYKPKKETEIANILGISSASIVSFDYYEDWNLKDYDVVEVYVLSDATINEFITNSSLILSDKSHEPHLWEKINWCNTPIDLTKWDYIYEMVFMSSRANTKSNKWIEEIKHILNTSNNFYSFYYKNDGATISFFTLSIKEKKMYCLYFKL